MNQAIKLLALAGLFAAANGNATLLTDLAGVTASAGSCYTGCGHAQYDASNILDHDFGGSGNTGFNSWNSGYWGGYVQVDFQNTYVFDRIELYGGYSYFDPYTLTGSLGGTNWFAIGSGGYHVESALTHTDTYGGIKYGAVYDVGVGSLGSDVEARFLRYTVNAGSPEWGYMFEMVADGHSPVAGDAAAVPEPQTLGLMGLAMVFLVMGFRRKRA